MRLRAVWADRRLCETEGRAEGRVGGRETVSETEGRVGGRETVSETEGCVGGQETVSETEGRVGGRETVSETKGRVGGREAVGTHRLMSVNRKEPGDRTLHSQQTLRHAAPAAPRDTRQSASHSPCMRHPRHPVQLRLSEREGERRKLLKGSG